MSKFKPGDTVRLKSGGPLMTVAEIEENDFVRCAWFDDKRLPQDKAFLEAILEADDGTVGV
jgi:uncharacterized protein YodC (DUF2158 family)